MTPSPLSKALAGFARRTRPELARIFAAGPTTAPAQRDRVADWLARCVAREPAAMTEAALAAALHDLLALRHAQLGFAAVPPRPGARPEAIVTADLGGAVALGETLAGLLRCVTAHDPDLAQRLLGELRRTESRQRTEIARAIDRR
jgi:hypothetical protein